MKLDYDRPNAALALELRQVRRGATNLRLAVETANSLPEDFPRDVLIDLCAALEGLEDGTAENSRPVLEYSRSKIPEIRRTFFLVESSEMDIKLGDETPRLYRGMAIDNELTSLIGSVTTALDEYRAQAQERFDDGITNDASQQMPTTTRFKNAPKLASDLIDLSETTSKHLRQKGLDQYKTGETLVRRITDTRNLTLAARSQINSVTIVRRWFDSIRVAIRAMPDLLIKAGQAITVSSDIAQELASWWSRTEHEITKSFINQVQDFGATLQKIGRALKTPRDLTDTEFANAKAIELLIRNQSIPDALARRVTELSFGSDAGSWTPITSWREIRKCINVKLIDVSRTDFKMSRDGHYLSGLRNLNSLSLYGQTEEDVKALAYIDTLSHLGLNSEDISSLSDVRHHKNLRSIDLRVRNLHSVSGIGGLSKLRYMRLYSRVLTDSSDIWKLKDLLGINLNVSKLTSVEGLANLRKLKYLSLTCHAIGDIPGIEYCDDLEEVKLNLPKLTTASKPFPSGIKDLVFHCDEVRDISGLSNLKRLKKLRMSCARLRDISALQDLTELDELRLSCPRVVDFDPLIRLTNLQDVSLVTSCPPDIARDLLNMQSLVSLSLACNSWESLGDLPSSSNVRRIVLSGSGDVDLVPLTVLPKLESVTINGPHASGVGVLREIGVTIY